MKKLIIILPVLILSHFAAQTQNTNDTIAQKLDEYLVAANKMNKFNGNTLIVQKGKVLLQKSYGYKNFAGHILNDSNTIFQIGSITKQFTATIILKLQEEARLSVHDKLSKYFPEFKYADEITIENLLTHTSGIYNYTNEIDAGDSALVCNPINKNLAIEVMQKHAPDFKPGATFRYSNSGYYLLGLIIEKVTGKSYEQNIRDLIFTPLQMEHSLFDFSHSADTNIAKGYQSISIKSQIEATAWRWDSTVTYAAGGMWSTTSDMYKWAQAIANKKIISAASWNTALTPQLQHYGYGWVIDSAFGKKAIAHGGGIPGFIAYLCYYPDEDVTIILLNNYGGFGDALNGINGDLSAIIFNKPYTLLKDYNNKKLPNNVLKKYIGKYAFDKDHHVYVSIQNKQLQLEAPEGGVPKSPLFAQDETNFYLKVITARIEFLKDESGNITGFISHYNGKDEFCKKIE